VFGFKGISVTLLPILDQSTVNLCMLIVTSAIRTAMRVGQAYARCAWAYRQDLCV